MPAVQRVGSGNGVYFIAGSKPLGPRRGSSRQMDSTGDSDLACDAPVGDPRTRLAVSAAAPARSHGLLPRVFSL